VATLVLCPSRSIDRSIDRSINQSVVIKAPYTLTTKSDLELFPLVTSSDEDITIFRGYYCKYQLAERPVWQGIICETSGKCASQTSKQKLNRAKHFGWHWLFKFEILDFTVCYIGDFVILGFITLGFCSVQGTLCSWLLITWTFKGNHKRFELLKVK